MKARARVLVVRRLIRHPRKRVFSALTDPAKMAQWFFGMKTGHAKVTLDLRPGGKYRIEMSDGVQTCDPHGTYLEITPPSRLVFTWSLEGREAESTVTIELEARGEATQLILKHELPPAKADEHRQGWLNCIDHLESFLERHAHGIGPTTATQRRSQSSWPS
jgi:uncharacterized protein YndB with AHSA1/START domain